MYAIRSYYGSVSSEYWLYSLLKIESNLLVSVITSYSIHYTKLYEEETDHQTAIMSSMLEPFLIIVVGGMVALILGAMYLPMFKLGSSLMG